MLEQILTEEISLENHETRKKYMKPKNYIKIVYNA